MADKKLIAVIGATGAQGGGLVRAIVSRPERRVRGPRDHARPELGEGAKALAGARRGGREADLDDRASLERAFAGAYGVYAVTNFWEHFRPTRRSRRRATSPRPSRLPATT